jgi:hypothetical protein
MKALKINQPVNLNSGIAIPSGSIVVIAEGYADVKSTKDGMIPSQVSTFLYVSESAIAEGKSPIIDIADYSPVFSGLELSIADYQTKTAEALLIDAVQSSLDKVYGVENVEEINL